MPANFTKVPVPADIGGAADAQSTVLEDELAKINKDIYQRNAELILRNRTLLVLSKIYQIINTSLGVEETSQKLIDAVVTELGFLKSFIALIDPVTQELKITAVSHSGEQSKKIQEADELLKKFSLPLTQSENLCAKAVQQRTRRMTNNLQDVLGPSLTPAQTAIIQQTFGFKTVLVDPILFAGEVLGVLMVGMDKHIGYLSKAEFEALKGIIDVVGIAIERSQLYKDLKDANIKLQEMDTLKSEFVSVASHELRTPMTAIRSYLWMALAGKGGPLADKQKFYLQRAYTSTVRLIALVNDMLNVSRIESGRVTIDMQRVDLTKTAEETLAEIMPRATELGLKLVLQKSAIPNVLADTNKIKEVLINLIGNSLKFTPKGGFITVSFEVKNNVIITHVTDTGVGISAEDLPKLFQKFALLHGSYKANPQASQGTGLGLYISKSIIELHGGQIWVASKGVNQGTRFSFSLKSFSDAELKAAQEKFKGRGEVGIIHTTV